MTKMTKESSCNLYASVQNLNVDQVEKVRKNGAAYAWQVACCILVQSILFS